MSVNQHKEMGNSRSNNGEDYAEKRAPKRRSEVWDHFTLIEDTKRAICNYCNEDLQGDSKQGTSHLKRHLQNKHLADEYARTNFQSSIKKIIAEDTTVFGPETLVLSGEINGASVASSSRYKKRAPLSGEPMEDDRAVEKQARLNKEEQLKRPIKESGVIPQQNILTGENNKLTGELSNHLALQIQNISNTKFGEALKIFVSDHSQLIEQNHQLETQIKEHKEALDRARLETKELTEARFAAENKVSDITLELDKLHNEKAQIEEALQIQNDSNLKLGDDLKISSRESSQLIEKNNQLETQIKEHKEALDRARLETKEQTEARIAVENKVSDITLELDKLHNEKAQIEEALQIQNDSNLKLGDDLKISSRESSQLIEKNNQLETQIKEHEEALDRARVETREQMEARVSAENKVSALTLELNKLSNEKAQIKEALQIPNYSNFQNSVSEHSQLIEQNCQLENQIKEHKEALDRVSVETREHTEARFAAENKVSALTLECNKLSIEKDRIKKALDRAREETKEARVVAEQQVSELEQQVSFWEERVSYFQEEIRLGRLLHDLGLQRDRFDIRNFFN